MPAPPRSESRVTPLPVFNRVLRFRFIDFSPKFEAAFYAFVAQSCMRRREFQCNIRGRAWQSSRACRSPGGPLRLRETRIC
jgi:hypothetical protein